MGPNLTKPETRVLDAVRQHYAEFGFPPSYRQLAHRAGFKSIGSIHQHVHALVEKGVLSVEPVLGRTVTINEGFE